jgi:hypothetical protein
LFQHGRFSSEENGVEVPSFGYGGGCSCGWEEEGKETQAGVLSYNQWIGSTPEGDVVVPEVLRPYMGGLEVLKKD